MNHQRRYLLFSLAVVLGAHLSMANEARANFEYSPVVGELTTSGKTASLLTKVTSHDEADIPVIIRVFERTMSPTGEEVRTETTELSVFPTQFILPAKGQKFVKVAWRGAADLPFEKSFRILVEHAPVDLNQRKVGAAAIRIMTNYSGMIYVNSRPSAPNVSVVRLAKKSDQRTLELEVVNEGERHLILSEPVLDVTCKSSESGSFVLKGPALKNLEGVNMLARSSLKTTVSAPQKLKECSDFSWQLRYSLK